MKRDTSIVQPQVSTQQVLDALSCGSCHSCRQARERGHGLVHCPCHVDSTPSLSVNEGERQPVVVKCMAGCEQAAVLAALRERNLFLGGAGGTNPVLLFEHKQPVQQRQRLSHDCGEQRRLVVSWRMPTPDGRVAIHERRQCPHHGQRDATGRKINGKATPWRIEGRVWPDGRRQYGLNGIRTRDLLYSPVDLALLSIDVPIILTEGEGAADAVHALKLPSAALVCGASGTPTATALQPLAWRSVYLWPDNDDAGQGLMQRTAAVLHTLGATARRVWWSEAHAKDDAADFRQRGGTAAQLKALLAVAQPCAPSDHSGQGGRP